MRFLLRVQSFLSWSNDGYGEYCDDGWNDDYYYGDDDDADLNVGCDGRENDGYCCCCYLCCYCCYGVDDGCDATECYNVDMY